MKVDKCIFSSPCKLLLKDFGRNGQNTPQRKIGKFSSNIRNLRKPEIHLLNSTFIIQFIPNSKMIGMNICRIKTPKIKILKLTRKCSKYKQNVYEVAHS